MPDVQILSGTIEPYSGTETELVLRITLNKTITNSGNETIIPGRTSTGVYLDVPCAVQSPCDDDTGTGIVYEAFELDPTTNATPGDSAYKIDLYTTGGDKVDTVFEKLYVPPSDTPLTLHDLNAYTLGVDGCNGELDQSYVLMSYFLSYMAQLSDVSLYATTTRKGVGYASASPLVADSPIFMEKNDPKIRGLIKSYYTEEFSSVQNARDTLVALGTAPIELVWTCPMTHAAASTVDFPANITHRFVASSLLTVSNAGGKVIIRGAVEAPARQLFGISSGIVWVIDGFLHLEWWTGTPTDTTDYTFQLTQAIESQHQTGHFGGTIYVGKGKWYVKDVRRRPYTHIEGAGNSIDMGAGGNPAEGTIFALASGTSTCVFLNRAEPIAGGVAHDDNVPHVIGFKNLGITTSSATSPCVLNTAPLGYGIYDCYYENVGFQGTYEATGTVDDGIILCKYDTDGTDIGFEVIGQIYRNCWAEVPGCGRWIYCDSSNSSFMFDNCHPVCGIGAWAFWFLGAGWVDINNLDARGAGGTYGGMTKIAWRNITQATITHYTDLANAPNFSLITIVSGTAFKEDDKGKVCDMAGFTDAYIDRVLSPTQAILSWHPPSFDYTALVNIAVSMFRFSDQPTIAGGVTYVNGIFQNITMRNGVEEGFNYVAKIRGAPYYGSFNFDGYTGQGKVELMGSCQVFSTNSYWNSLSWRDRANELNPGEQAIVTLRDRYIHHGTVHLAVTVFEGTRWEIIAGARVEEEFFVQPSIYGFDTGGGALIGFNAKKYMQDDGLGITTRNLFHDKKDALLFAGSPLYSQDPDKSLSQVIASFGPADPCNPSRPWDGYQYQWLHHTYSGWLWLLGQQTGFTALALDVDLRAMKDIYLDAAHVFFAQGDIKASKSVQVITKSGSAQGIGYGAGSGASVTQTTNRSTTVTINAPSGQIVTDGTSLAIGAKVTFKVLNSCFGATDVIGQLNVQVAFDAAGVPTDMAFQVHSQGAGEFWITYTNNRAGALIYPVTIRFWKQLHATS